MRKRYSRKYRYRSPRWKWKIRDEARLLEWERQGKYVRLRRRSR